MPQIHSILPLSDLHYTSPWLKKLLKFNVNILKRSRFAGFCCNFVLSNFPWHEILPTHGARCARNIEFAHQIRHQNGHAHGRLSDHPRIRYPFQTGNLFEHFND